MNLGQTAKSADHFRFLFSSTSMPPRKTRGTLDPENEEMEVESTPIEIPDDDLDLSSSSEEEYEDDPVVKTYDVFLSDQLKDQIYLLQYPIRNVEEQYLGEEAPYNARIKPGEGALEMDVPIDTQNFSISRSERFVNGLATDVNVKREVKTFDRQRLSGKAQPNQASYFVALALGGLNYFVLCSC
jgi:RPC5 protein